MVAADLSYAKMLNNVFSRWRGKKNEIFPTLFSLSVFIIFQKDWKALRHGEGYNPNRLRMGHKDKIMPTRVWYYPFTSSPYNNDPLVHPGYTANVNRDEQGFDRYLAVQGWLDNIL